MTATIPEVIAPQSLRDYLEVMARAVFQTGLSWRQIAVHWEAYRAAFEDFDVSRVATFDEIDVERVLATSGVLRSPRKIHAVIRNAREMLDLERAPGGFAGYLRSFADYASLAKDLKRRFAFMGEMNVWYFLFRAGVAVPQFEPWITTIPGKHPRMREMVELAREQGRSPERP